jgi:hypothetical protein
MTLHEWHSIMAKSPNGTRQPLPTNTTFQSLKYEALHRYGYVLKQDGNEGVRVCQFCGGEKCCVQPINFGR